MTDDKPTRRELLRPLQLLSIALACGIFAAAVTFLATGGFTESVNASIAAGTYQDLPPLILCLIAGGIAFIAALLVLSLLMLSVDPKQFGGTMDRGVLLPDSAQDTDAAQAPDAQDGASKQDEKDSPA